jgi:hypothetical protein
MWSPLYSKSIKLLVSKIKLMTKFYFTTLWYHKFGNFFKNKTTCSIPRFLFYGTKLRCHWGHVGECIWECIAQATSFLHWWQMSSLVHSPAQMTHMDHHTLTVPSSLLYLRAQLIHFVANASLGMLHRLAWAFFTLIQYASSGIIRAVHSRCEQPE